MQICPNLPDAGAPDPHRPRAAQAGSLAAGESSPPEDRRNYV